MPACKLQAVAHAGCMVGAGLLDPCGYPLPRAFVSPSFCMLIPACGGSSRLVAAQVHCTNSVQEMQLVLGAGCHGPGCLGWLSRCVRVQVSLDLGGGGAGQCWPNGRVVRNPLCVAHSPVQGSGHIQVSSVLGNQSYGVLHHAAGVTGWPACRGSNEVSASTHCCHCVAWCGPPHFIPCDALYNSHLYAHA